MNNGEIVSFVWGVADLIRDTFRRGHYQDVILPLTILRRLDCGAQDILKILRDFKDGDTRLVKKDGTEEETIVSRTSTLGRTANWYEAGIRLAYKGRLAYTKHYGQ